MKKLVWVVIGLAVVVLVVAGVLVYNSNKNARTDRDIKEINHEVVRLFACMGECPATVYEQVYGNETCVNANCTANNCSSIIHEVSDKYPYYFISYPHKERKKYPDLILDNGDYGKCFALRCNVPEFIKCVDGLRIKYEQ